MSQLSLVDAAGALRDANAALLQLDIDIASAQAKLLAMEERSVLLRKELREAKDKLIEVSLQDKVTIL